MKTGKTIKSLESNNSWEIVGTTKNFVLLAGLLEDVRFSKAKFRRMLKAGLITIL